LTAQECISACKAVQHLAGMETNLLVATRCGEEQHDAKLGALNQLKRLITGVRP